MSGCYETFSLFVGGHWTVCGVRDLEKLLRRRSVWCVVWHLVFGVMLSVTDYLFTELLQQRLSVHHMFHVSPLPSPLLSPLYLDAESLDSTLWAEPNLGPWEGSSALVTEPGQAGVIWREQTLSLVGGKVWWSPHLCFVVEGLTVFVWGRGTKSSSCCLTLLSDCQTWPVLLLSCQAGR